MKKKKRFLALLLLVLSTSMNAFSQELTVTVETPGTLKDLMKDEYDEITKLTLKGKLNKDDYVFLQEFLIDDMIYLDLKDIETTEIPDHAFYGISVNTIVLPTATKTIGVYPFRNCNSTKAIIIDKGNDYFSTEKGVLFNKEKTELIYYPRYKPEKTYTFPASVKTIAAFAFAYAQNLTGVTLYKGVEIIGEQAFYSCNNLQEINIPNSVKAIKMQAFRSCSKLMSIAIPASVTDIENGAFWDCINITSITLENNMKSIDDDVFKGCNISSIILPEGLISIGNNSFNLCKKLTSITFPEGLTQIGNEAFLECKKLTSLSLPASLTSIGESAFGACEKVATVTCKAPVPPTLGKRAFIKLVYSPTLYVPKGSLEAYKNNADWRRWFQKIYEISTPVGNESIETSKSIMVYAIEQGVQIETEDLSFVEIYSIGGELVKQVQVNGSEQVSLHSGTYIVKSKGFSQIVIIK